MSPMTKPRLWLCSAAAAAALWITFRILNADAAALPAGLAAEEVSLSAELPDPALDALIHRLAEEAASSPAKTHR